MKKWIIYEILKRAPLSLKRSRNLKIFATIAIVGVILSATLMVWATFTTISFLTKTAGSLNVSEKIEQVTETLTEKQSLLQPGCLNKVHSMLNLAQWLERPLQQNTRELKEACLHEDIATPSAI